MDRLPVEGQHPGGGFHNGKPQLPGIGQRPSRGQHPPYLFQNNYGPVIQQNVVLQEGRAPNVQLTPSNSAAVPTRHVIMQPIAVQSGFPPASSSTQGLPPKVVVGPVLSSVSSIRMNIDNDWNGVHSGPASVHATNSQFNKKKKSRGSQPGVPYDEASIPTDESGWGGCSRHDYKYGLQNLQHVQGPSEGGSLPWSTGTAGQRVDTKTEHYGQDQFPEASGIGGHIGTPSQHNHILDPVGGSAMSPSVQKAQHEIDNPLFMPLSFDDPSEKYEQVSSGYEGGQIDQLHSPINWETTAAPWIANGPSGGSKRRFDSFTIDQSEQNYDIRNEYGEELPFTDHGTTDCQQQQPRGFVGELKCQHTSALAWNQPGMDYLYHEPNSKHGHSFPTTNTGKKSQLQGDATHKSLAK